MPATFTLQHQYSFLFCIQGLNHIEPHGYKKNRHIETKLHPADRRFSHHHPPARKRDRLKAEAVSINSTQRLRADQPGRFTVLLLKPDDLSSGGHAPHPRIGEEDVPVKHKYLTKIIYSKPQNYRSKSHHSNH